MYEFIRTQWILRKVTAEWVLAQVPRWITQEQADEILATPQVPGDAQ